MAAMNQHRKFLFEDRFDVPAQPRQTPVEIAREELRAEFEAERTQAYRDGEAAALSGIENETLRSVGELVEQAKIISQDLEKKTQAIRRDAVMLAVAAAKKLAGGMIAREPEAEIEACFVQALSVLPRSGHINLSVAPELAARLQPLIDAQATRTGTQATILIEPNPEIHAGDCTVGWETGGMVYDKSRIAAEIDTAVAHYLETHKTESKTDMDNNSGEGK